MTGTYSYKRDSMTNDIEQQANTSINNYIKSVAAISLLPLPLLDLLAITALQIKMIHRLSNLYDVEFKEDSARAAITALLGSAIPLSIKSSLFSMTKTIPFVGSATGALGLSALAASSTYAIGKVFKYHYETGGTLLDFNADTLREYYHQQTDKAKEAITEEENGAGVRP